MFRKFKLANGLPATLQWLNDRPDIAKCCQKTLIFDPKECALIIIYIENAKICLVGWAIKENLATAKEIVKFWSTNAKAPSFARWVVYNEECHALESEIGKLLLHSIKTKVPPGITFLLRSSEPTVRR